MLTKWFNNLDETEAKELRLHLQASRKGFERLSVLLQQDIDASIKTQESRTLYESPSWAMYHADSIGEIRTYKKILRLINLKEI